MNRTILKYLFIVLCLIIFGCSSDDNDDRPFCSEYNEQNPNDDFIPCENEESPCKCG